jgi:type IV pilus assembly protein PilQ
MGSVYATSAFAADKAAEATSPGVFGQVTATDAVVAESDKNLPEGQTVEVGSLGQVELHVKNADLTQVLQLLSIQSQKNIVATKNVSGSITADLYGVDFYESLDAILTTNGFGWREKGNFIYVYTLDELKAIEDAERKLVHRVIRLNYLTGENAKEIIQPVMSSAGTVVFNESAKSGIEADASDAGANSYAYSDMVIVHDYAEHADEAAKLIQELDVRPKQVLIEASILRARVTEDNAFGVDLTILADFAMSEFTSPLSTIDDLIAGSTGPSGGSGQTATGGTNPNSTLAIGVVSDDIAAFVSALDAVTDTTVLANPKLLVLNRQRASLLVGQKLGYLSTQTNDTSTTQTVEFLEVGTQLSVRPFVGNDDFIRLELNPSISDGETRELGGFVVPNETTQELTTNIMVRNAQTVVLGGLYQEDTTVTRRQVPFLGDVPVLGTAFKGQTDTHERNEVIFLVTPTIVRDEVLYAAGERAADGFEIARLGARSGLLPWSRTKMESSHLQDAMRYQMEGKDDKALLAVNMALNLNPTNAEALRMKEGMTGERAYGANYSILRDALDGMIDTHVNEVAPATEQPATEPAADEPAPEAAAPAPAGEAPVVVVPAPAEAFSVSEPTSDGMLSEVDTNE